MRPHKTAEQDSDMLAKMAALPDKEQEHFKALVRVIASCYGADAVASGVAVFTGYGRDSELVVVPINANDMQIADMLLNATREMTSVVMDDAPPKELFN